MRGPGSVSTHLIKRVLNSNNGRLSSKPIPECIWLLQKQKLSLELGKYKGQSLYRLEQSVKNKYEKTTKDRKRDSL